MDIVQLVQQLKAGDDTSGPVLVSIIAPRLLGYAEAIGGDLSLADREKAVELAIEKAIQKIDQYDPQRGTFPGWTRTFVRRSIADWRRLQLLGSPLELDERTTPAAPEHSDDEEDEDLDPSSAALALLVLTAPETDQLMIRLRFEDNLPHAEIANQLGVSESACRKRLERALQRLRSRAAQEPDLNRYLEGGKE